MSGVPTTLEINNNMVEDANAIVHHVLSYVNPEITPQNYKILKHFEPREGHNRHSTKVKYADQNIKKKIFEGCKKFTDLPEASPIRRVWIKNEDTPLQKKENYRLYTILRELHAEENEGAPVNTYKIKGGK